MGVLTVTVGRAAVRFEGVPALTLREIRLGWADERNGRHWSRSRCWCGADHHGEATTLPLVPPPWDASRMSESAGGVR